MDSPDCANLVGPTIDIPPEVFLRICEFTVSGLNPLSPLFLGKVCRAWRHLCYSTPSLWTQPKITFKADASQIILLKEWIHRAGDLPLNLHICDPTDFLNGRHEPPQCIPLLELMAEKAPQIRTFILEAPSASLLHLPRWNYSGPSFTSERYRWSILSRLHLSYVDDDIVPIFDNCPQLTDLGFDYSSHWHSTKSIVTLPWIPWKNLRRANFRGFGYDDLLRVLRKARDLETLHSTFVSDVTEYYGGGPTKDYWNGPGLNETPKPPRNLMIHHQKLKSWMFSQKTKQHLSFTFYNMMLLRLPALKTLNVHWEDSSKYGTYHRPAEATKGWDCALRQFEVSLVGFRQEYVAEWIKAPEMSTLRSLKLHWEHHGEHSSLELSSDLFVAMTASPGKEPVLPKLRFLVVEDTPLGFSPDIIIAMLASRWDNGADFPLKSCAIIARVSENLVWHVTEEHHTALRRWRERGYTVELGISERTVEEEEEEEEGERVADYMGKEYIFRAV